MTNGVRLMVSNQIAFVLKKDRNAWRVAARLAFELEDLAEQAAGHGLFEVGHFIGVAALVAEEAARPPPRGA